MKENVNESTRNGNGVTPMLFPYEPALYWQQIRQIIREEVRNIEKDKPVTPVYDTPGMTYKPLYKIAEVCAMFQVTKPTIYEWIKHGKLKPFKVRSRVFFLFQDIQQLLHSGSPE